MPGKRAAPLAAILSRLAEGSSAADPVPRMMRILSEAVAADAVVAVRFGSDEGATLLGGLRLRIPPEATPPLARPGRLAHEAEKALGSAAVTLSAREWDDPLLDFEGARHVALSSRRGGRAVLAAIALRRRGSAFTRSERARFAAAGGFVSLSLACNELQREARRAKGVDPLTGLPPYGHFHDALTRELSRARRTGRPLTVGMASAPGLAPEQGPILAAAAALMKDQLREFDTLARHGAAEFVFVLPELAAADAVRVTDRVLEAVGAELALPDPVRLVSGLACYPEDASTSERLIEVAEAVLSEAVDGGRSGAHRPQTWQAAGSGRSSFPVR